VPWAGAPFSALVNIYPDGSVRIDTSGVEMGQGLNVKAAQVSLQAETRFLIRAHENVRIQSRNGFFDLGSLTQGPWCPREKWDYMDIDLQGGGLNKNGYLGGWYALENASEEAQACLVCVDPLLFLHDLEVKSQEHAATFRHKIQCWL
jgi:hypothetical protein